MSPKYRTIAAPIFEGLPQCGCELGKVGEQDRSIKLEAPDRLKSDLGGVLRRVAQAEHTAGSLTSEKVLRQVAPSLAHQPNRRAFGSLTCQCA